MGRGRFEVCQGPLQEVSLSALTVYSQAPHHSPMRIRALLCLLAFRLAAGVAHADDLTAAREHFRRGSTAYDLGRFLDAAHEYEAAYEAKADPSLLFNIGQSYRFVPDYPKAILAFKAYLRNAPNAPNRAEVETRIFEMQQQPPRTNAPLSPQPGAPTAAPSATLAQPKGTAPETSRLAGESGMPGRAAAPSGRSLLIAGGVVAAVGVALVATGGAFVEQTRAADDNVNRPRPGTRFSPSLVDTLNRDQALEATFFAVGGAALITGAVVAIVGSRRLRSERKLSWQPILDHGAAGAVLAGAW
jgi:tetratricopeptide (TPR) repeat protein